MGEIIVKHGEKKRMAKLFGCTTQTIKNALREVTISELTDRIREEAVKSGGMEQKRRRVSL